MEKLFIGLGVFVSLIIFAGVIGLLMAFPIMWSWNHVMPYLFEFKTITWGQAWCLNFLAGMLIQSQFSHNKDS